MPYASISPPTGRENIDIGVRFSVANMSLNCHYKSATAACLVPPSAYLIKEGTAYMYAQGSSEDEIYKRCE